MDSGGGRGGNDQKDKETRGRTDEENYSRTARKDSRIKARDAKGMQPLLELCEQKYFIKLGQCRGAAAGILMQTHALQLPAVKPLL